MPTTASRPPPPPLSLHDDCPRSPPSYPKPPSSSLPSTPKPALSPRTEKKSSLSPPLEAEGKKLDKSDRRPDPPSDPRAEPPSEAKADSKPAAKEAAVEVNETTEEQDGGSIIDFEIFNQILELDEDDSREFSRSMVQDFYVQAEETFAKMDRLFKSENLLALSDNGHFLKGSSAAIGLKKVQKSCEEIQHYGNLRDETNDAPIPREDALERLGKVLVRVRKEYDEVKAWLDKFFGP